MEGWIKIHRKILEWEWYKDNNTKILFLHLLLTANHKEKKWQGITILRGQKLTSLQHLAEETNLTIQQTRTSLNKLKLTNEITIETTNKNTLITIEKYSDYQDKDEENNIQNNTQNNNQITNEQQTNNKQITTNKNDKNIKNDKNEKNIRNIKEKNIKKENETEIQVMDIWEKQFEDFYKQYPRKVKKQDVKKWFNKNKPSKELFNKIINSLNEFKKSKDWTKDNGQYIPHPTSWLNQKRWEDENIIQKSNTISALQRAWERGE